MNITVKTEVALADVTLTFINSDRMPITQQTGINCETTFTDINESCRIDTNDRIVSTITEIFD